MIKFNITLISLFFIFYSNCAYSSDDPLDDEFYESPSELARIEKSLDELIKIGKAGVKNSKELVELQVNQAVIEARSRQNQIQIEKHSGILNKITETLSECIQKLNTQKESYDLWVNFFLGLIVSGFSIFGTWYFIERKKVNKKS